MKKSLELLKKVYDPESFRYQALQVAELLTTHLRQSLSGELPAVLPWSNPEDLLQRWAVSKGQDLTTILKRYESNSVAMHHPGYVGHQNAPVLPVSALCDFFCGLMNNSLAIYEMGSAGIMVEKTVIAWLNSKAGYSKKGGGVLTSGGSLGNLTALLAARQARAGFDAWEEGLSAKAPLAVLASGYTHYCVKRAVQIMGMGEQGLVTVPVDGNFAMRTDALEQTYAKAVSEGKKVIAVAATAGTTATGSYDPLPEIADFCASRQLWFHVDGAHGASALLSKKHRKLARGIERADSIVWDLHKMMALSSISTAVLFRDNRSSNNAFNQKASYLFEKPPEEEWYNPCHRTVECTRRDLGLRLFVSLSLYGEDVFEAYVDQTHQLARRFYAMLDTDPSFELPVAPQSNVVCFRPWGIETDQELSSFRMRIIQEGDFYLVQTRLNGKLYLRVTFMNPFTSTAQLQQLCSRCGDLR